MGKQKDVSETPQEKALQGMGDIAARSGQQEAQDAQFAAQRRAGNAQLVGQVARLRSVRRLQRRGRPHAGRFQPDRARRQRLRHRAGLRKPGSR
jgi:hypothetical protein